MVRSEGSGRKEGAGQARPLAEDLGRGFVEHGYLLVSDEGEGGRKSDPGLLSALLSAVPPLTMWPLNLLGT